MIKDGKRGMWISLCCGFLILGLAACNLPGAGAGDPEPTVTGGESQDVELGQQEQALKKVNCPTDASLLYELKYTHEAVLNLEKKGEDSFYLEEKEQQPAYFYFWIEPSGKVTSEGLPNSVTINVSGKVVDSDSSGSCPVQELQGSWLLAADITGTCKKGVVTLNVKEDFVSNELTGSCGDPISIPGGGPELTLTFNLSEPGSTDGLISGSRGDPTYVFYWYQFNPSDLWFNTPQTPGP